MKDAQGHGSNASGVASAAHQTGIETQLNPSIAEGRELYAHLSEHAQDVNPTLHSGFSDADARGFAGREQGGNEYGQFEATGRKRA